MQTVTQVLATNTPFKITNGMNIIAFSIVGISTDAAFSYLGTATVSNGTGSNLSPQALSFSGQFAYNSRIAPPDHTWENIVITCTAGTVGLELSTN